MTLIATVDRLISAEDGQAQAELGPISVDRAVQPRISTADLPARSNGMDGVVPAASLDVTGTQEPDGFDHEQDDDGDDDDEEYDELSWEDVPPGQAPPFPDGSAVPMDIEINDFDLALLDYEIGADASDGDLFVPREFSQDLPAVIPPLETGSTHSRRGSVPILTPAAVTPNDLAPLIQRIIHDDIDWNLDPELMNFNWPGADKMTQQSMELLQRPDVPLPHRDPEPPGEVSSGSADSLGEPGSALPGTDQDELHDVWRVISKMREALRDSNLPGLLATRLPPMAKFPFAWRPLKGSQVTSLLEQLQEREPIKETLIDYFAAKLSRDRRTTRVHILRASDAVEWSELSPVPDRFLVPRYVNGWLLIEADHVQGAVVHYGFPACPLPADHQRANSCNHCDEVIWALSYFLSQVRQPIPDWTYRTQTCTPKVPEDAGLFLLEALRCRARREDVRDDLPDDYRVGVAQEIFYDMCGALQSDNIQSALFDPVAPQGGRLTAQVERPEPTLREQWRQFSKDHDFGDRLLYELDNISQTTTGGDVAAPIGIARASQLLQLALNIAAPDVFLTLKKAIGHIRDTENGRPVFESSAWGLFEAYRWHGTNKVTASIGSRLCHWGLYMSCKSSGLTKSNFAERIWREKPRKSDVSLQDVQNCITGLKGDKWNHLVEAFQGQANVLCFIPTKVTVFSHKSGLHPTAYRDLSRLEADLVWKLFAGLRPSALPTHSPCFFEIFTSNQVPSYRYRFEQWSNDEINSKTLQSNLFADALQPEHPGATVYG
jgi:hypothetical protein